MVTVPLTGAHASALETVPDAHRNAAETCGACTWCLNGAGSLVRGPCSGPKPRRRTAKDGEDALVHLVMALLVLVLAVIALVAMLAVMFVGCNNADKCEQRHQRYACCHHHGVRF
jgi:hypothetical protein